MPRNLLRAAIIVLIAAGAFAAWHFLFNDGTVRVTITQKEIDEALARKFPKRKTYAKVLHVEYLNPVVRMIPGQKRVLVSLDVRAGAGVPGIVSKSYDGHATIITRVRYEADSHRFFLVDPSVETLELPGLSQSHMNSLREGLNLGAGLWFDDIPVHRIKDRDLRTRIARMALRRIEILDDRVVATLGTPEKQDAAPASRNGSTGG